MFIQKKEILINLSRVRVSIAMMVVLNLFGIHKDSRASFFDLEQIATGFNIILIYRQNIQGECRLGVVSKSILVFSSLGKQLDNIETVFFRSYVDGSLQICIYRHYVGSVGKKKTNDIGISPIRG